MRERLRDFYLTLDLRSLALFRIALALLLLHDAAVRWPDLETFYGANGVLPPDAPWRRFNPPLQWSLLEPLRTVGALRAAFMVGMLCELALLAGFYTRIAHVASFLFLVSVRNRNALLSQGGDAVLTVICLWGLLLPLGARWSVDAWRAARGRPRAAPPPVRSAASLAGLAYAFQIGFIYLTTAIAKSGPAWHDGSAVYFALHIDQFATPLGVWVRQAPFGFLAALSHGTIAFEWAALPLILAPWRQPWPRRIALAGLLFFHLGTAFTMTLGAFPLVMCASFLPLLRPTDWVDLQRLVGWWRRRRGASVAPAAPVPLATQPAPPRWVRRALDAAAVALVVCIVLDGFNASWARRLGRDPVPLPVVARAPALAFDLDQGWRMFAPEPLRRDGWWVVVGETETGATLDPLTGRAPNWDKPVVSTHSVYWRMYLFSISRPEMRMFQIYFARWLAGRTHPVPPERRLRRLEFWWVQEDTPPPGTPAPPLQRFRLWSWDGSRDAIVRGDV